MESEKTSSKDMKLEIPSGSEIGIEFQGGQSQSQGGLARQTSISKTNCLCSPTTHAGSFRCRLHRAPSLQRTKSIESGSLRDQTSMVVDAAVADANKDQSH